MTRPESAAGRQLWGLLPEVYRTRDNGDLGKYLDACGELLDVFRATLDQRLADSFPEGETAGLAAQGWLLPYIAQLLDVRLLSPHLEGRRAEVARAVSWRQRKGTATSIEEIAESVGQLEVEIQEGWKRVAVTPRVGDGPATDALATLDLGYSSRAVRAEGGGGGVRRSRFSGQAVSWRQAHSSGVPCFAGSFEDASPRTPDTRTPGWNRGHFHPRRLLLFAPPAAGFFPLDGVALEWGERHDSAHREHIRDLIRDGERRVFNPGSKAVTVVTRPAKMEEPRVRIEGLRFLETVTVEGGRVDLSRVAARKLVVLSPAGEGPALRAVDCLFDEIEAPQGLVELEHCTVRGSLTCDRLHASDCLFAGHVGLGASGSSCVRFSRIPESLFSMPEKLLRRPSSISDRPIFHDFSYCDAAGSERLSSRFGGLGCGVLHPATPGSICFGAEDGGEMGAFHRQRLCLQAAAVTAKVEDFLPVGIEAVLIPDPRLLTAPPEQGSG